MNGRSHLRYILLVFPIVIVVLDLVFFFLDDYLDEGRPLFYLDTYGQGYFTWWLDFERFWGNVELWGLGIGVWTGFFTGFAFSAAPGALGARKASLVKWPLIVLVALIVLATIAGLAGWFSPAPYSIGGILVAGWYPEYLPANILFLLLVFSGIWLLFPTVSKLRRGRVVMPLSWKMAAALLVPAIVILHLALMSTWGVSLVNNLQKPLTSIIGFSFVVIPMFAFMVASIERQANQTPAPSAGEDARLDHHRKMYALVIMSSTLAILGVILVLLEVTDGLDTGIDLNSSFLPRNFLTWVSTALVATITFFTIQGGSGK